MTSNFTQLTLAYNCEYAIHHMYVQNTQNAPSTTGDEEYFAILSDRTYW